MANTAINFEAHARMLKRLWFIKKRLDFFATIMSRNNVKKMWGGRRGGNSCTPRGGEAGG